MAFKDLREFISTLEKHGEVQRIEQEVNWNLEAGAITRRVNELGLPAPLFEKIKGYPGHRMFGAPLSTFRRIAIAMDMNPDTPLRELRDEFMRRRKNLIKPRLVKREDALCKENIITGDEVNLFKFPAPMVHEGDGGRFIATWHIVITKDPDSDWVNWGIYRAMIHTKNTMGGIIHHFQHIGYHFFQKYTPRRLPMPYAMAIGTEPICSFVASSKVPPGVSEVEVVGGIRQEPVEMVKCETVDLEVPASSEIVFEGEVLPWEQEWEGPFGEFTGYRASPRDRRPIYRVKAITHRNDPILTLSCMGMPIDDCHAPMAITIAGEILEDLQNLGLPVVEVHNYPETSYQLTVISIRPTEANMASRIAHAVWGAPVGSHLPYLIIVEDDVDPSNLHEVMHALATKCHPYRGVRREEFAAGHALLPFLSRYERLNDLGAKCYFDCTWPLDWDPSIAVPPKASFDRIYSKEVQEHVLRNWQNYGYK